MRGGLEKYVPETFEPRHARYRFQLWVRVENADQSVGYHVFWRRVALALAAAFLFAWLAGAGAIAAFLRYHHGIRGLSYFDLAYPPRWSEHRRALGRSYLDRAWKRLAEKQPAEALADFAAGLARAPEDLRARRQLAILQLRFGNVPGALATLDRGIEAALDDLDYLKLACSLMFELQDDARVAALCRRFLPVAPDGQLTHQLLALNLARVHFRAGDYDATERLLTNWQLERSVEGLLLRAACDWERGYPELALQRIELGRARFPLRDEIPVQVVAYWLELGQPQRALEESIVRISADPVSPGPRIDLLHALHALGDGERYALEVGRFCRDFRSDPRALVQLAEFAASVPDLALVETALAQLGETPAALESARIALLIAQIESDRFPAALALAHQLKAQLPPGSLLETRVEGWRAVAARGAGDLANATLFLEAYAGSPRLAGADPFLVAKHLERLGAIDLARKVHAALLLQAPRHQGALTNLVRLDAAAGNTAGLEEFLPRLLETSKPSAAALEEAYLRLSPGNLRTRVQATLTSLNRSRASGSERR
jgi:tetratricopeptide (TPR) repeat protein